MKLMIPVLGLVLGCLTMNASEKFIPKNSSGTLGKIERLDPGLDALIAPGTEIEKLAEGFDWSEGPVWMAKRKSLLFSDVPQNVIYEWSADKGIREFLRPSGYTGSVPRGGEPGSNGLTLDSKGRLVSCEHGDRRVARLNADGQKTTLADRYEGKRFNSPNDLCFHSNGDLYFTDPPYGLLKNNQDPAKEIKFNGVYRVTPKGAVHLLTDKVSFPNGIALSPNEKTLYVAVSDGSRPVILSYDVKKDGSVENEKVFFNTAPLMAGKRGVPDGLKVDKKGNLFATGPGGVLIISPEGKHLGTILTGQATANCAWGEDGSVLYITADMFLCRVKTKTKGTILP